MFRGTVCAALLAMLPAAGTAASLTRWHCAYAPAEGEYVLCQLLEAPPDGPAPVPVSAALSRLPRFVRDIREAPHRLDGVGVAIPLHAPPIDMALAGQLARNVMCGARADCEVHFHAERQGLVQAERTGRRPSRR